MAGNDAYGDLFFSPATNDGAGAGPNPGDPGSPFVAEEDQEPVRAALMLNDPDDPHFGETLIHFLEIVAPDGF